MSSEQLEETWRLRNNMTGDSLEFTEQFLQFLRKTKPMRISCLLFMTYILAINGQKRNLKKIIASKNETW